MQLLLPNYSRPKEPLLLDLLPPREQLVDVPCGIRIPSSEKVNLGPGGGEPKGKSGGELQGVDEQLPDLGGYVVEGHSGQDGTCI
jgi:hypothetical protein